VYIEDIYKEFYKELLNSFSSIPTNDAEALSSFYVSCIDNKAFTEKQAGFMIFLMKKYYDLLYINNDEYTSILNNPQFKKPFRQLDYGKKVYIEKTQDNKISVCFKFPYAFKSTFDKVITGQLGSKNTGNYDIENQVRKVNFFDINIIGVYEFCLDHNFEIDESILHAVAETETAWENSEIIAPNSYIQNSSVDIMPNCLSSAEYFNENKQSSLSHNLFLAKTMGYPVNLNRAAETVLEKIVSSKTNTFWLKENTRLLELYCQLGCKICIILDRNENKFDWIKKFVTDANNLKIEKSKIKICFRENKDRGKEFNDWVKSSGYGGKVELGDIFIFDHKPAKWLFKDSNFVKIVVTTSRFPPTIYLTKDWIDSHPCTIYLSEIKPTIKGNKQLVNL
jgi:hypothetical protein